MTENSTQSMVSGQEQIGAGTVTGAPTPDNPNKPILVATPTPAPTATPTPAPTFAPTSSPTASAEGAQTPAVTPEATPIAGESVEVQVAETEAPKTLTAEIVTPAAPPLLNTPAWIGVALAAALLAAAATLLITRRLPKRAKPLPVDGTTESGSDEEPVTIADIAADLVVGNAQHIGRRDSQQDSFGVSDLSQRAARGVLAAVADGMGGLSNGAEISTAVVRTVLAGFAQLPPDADPAYRLVALAAEAHRAALKIAQNGGGGSTLLMAYIRSDQLYTLSVGDSRIYLWRGGSLIQLNREHVYAVDLDERAALGDIDREDAQGDPQRKALTSYLGMSDTLRFDRALHPVQLRPGDRIALMSDGVFGTVSETEIAAYLALDPYHAAMKLQEAVLTKNMPHQDNLTAVIIEYH